MTEPNAETELTAEGVAAMHRGRNRDSARHGMAANLLTDMNEREETPVPDHSYDPGAVQRSDTCREHGSVCARIEHAITLAEVNEKTSLRIEGRINEIFNLLGGNHHRPSNGHRPVDIKAVGVIVGGIAVALLSILSAYWTFVKDTRAESTLRDEVRQLTNEIRAQRVPQK